jgi:hypothetical protein
VAEYTNYTMRIPSQQYAQIKNAAQRERRSIHSQILWFLDRGMKETSSPGAEEITGVKLVSPGGE